MPTTNFFFNNFSSASEQRLLADLSTEMIKMYGVEAYYLPRTHVALDQLFNSDALSKFDHAIPLEMYIKNFSGYQGEGDMLSKFGITMADQITFCISRNRFSEDIGSSYNLIRPNEGDLVIFRIFLKDQIPIEDVIKLFTNTINKDNIKKELFNKFKNN